VVPTISFRLLYGLLILRHDRRGILWLGATAHPTAEWIAHQLTEACGWERAPEYLIHDRDRAYGEVFTWRVRAMGIRDRPTSPRSPWQNAYAERLIGSIRRECVDYVVVLGERHLRPSPAGSRFPAPIGSEPCAVPTDQGIRLDDRQRAANIGEQPIEADEYQSVGAAEEKPLWRGPPHGIDLLAQHQDLRLRLCSRSEQVDEHPPDQSAKAPHQATTSPDSPSSASRMRFTTGTGKIRSLAVLLGVGVAAVGATAGGSMMSIISQ